MLKTGPQQKRCYVGQLGGCSCRGISVGHGCMYADASCLKVCNWKRDNASANVLHKPGIYLALKTMLLY